jgi:hypothetical protein
MYAHKLLPNISLPVLLPTVPQVVEILEDKRLLGEQVCYIPSAI